MEQTLTGALGGAVVLLAQIIWRLVSGGGNGRRDPDPPPCGLTLRETLAGIRETLARVSDLLDRQAATDERTAALLEQVLRSQERIAEEVADVHRLASRTLERLSINGRRAADA